MVCGSDSIEPSAAATPDFESCGGRMLDLNDGHVPETFRLFSSSPCSQVKYPDFDDQPYVHVWDDAITTDLVQALYQQTVDSNPWGTYVTLKEAKAYMKGDQEPAAEDNKPHSLQHLSMRLVAQFLAKTTTSVGSTARYPPETQTPPLESILQDDRIHGVALWGLASDAKAQVQYHIDYAELIRYEYNVMVPPIYAGTLQCTSIPVKGGAFCVNLNGLEHYAKHGYKAAKSQDDNELAGWEEPPFYKEEIHYNDTSQWYTIPYRYNRLTCHSGHLPHFSTTVRQLSGTASKRVIIGFNFFCHDIGPLVQQAPEHSPEFRERVIRKRQEMAEQRTQLSLEKIMESKALTRLLVLAKREQVKRQLQQDQAKLDRAIRDLLLNSDDGTMRISDMMEKLASTKNTDEYAWPNEKDVHVHLHHRIKDGDWLKCCDKHDDSCDTVQEKRPGLVSLDAWVSLSGTVDS